MGQRNDRKKMTSVNEIYLKRVTKISREKMRWMKKTEWTDEHLARRS